jgi:antagonist of KipI
MAIKIIRPGILTTIQDLGRTGHRSVGIGPGGSMDFFATIVANYLVGNDEKSPVIEMHFPAPEMSFEADAQVSITGADFSACIDDEPVELWKPLLVKKNQRLSFKKYINGARACLAIYGGIKADNWLNSFSTHSKVKAGGFNGRPLLKGDSIFLNEIDSLRPIKNFPTINKMISPVYQPANIIRCLAGPEWYLLNDESKMMVLRSKFLMTAQSDRMGYRLQGTNLALEDPVQLISSPVDSGTVQLLPNGQLIILMADHQTTGGYPRIANVISADLPKLAQLSIHSELLFELAGIETAEEALFSLYETLESIKNYCKIYYDSYRHQL